MFEYDKHYRDCTQNNIPFIKAKTNPTNGAYHVQIDLMPCKRIFSEEGKQNLKKLFDAEIKCKNPKNQFAFDYSIDKELSWIDGIAPERLDGFCESLYDLSQKFTMEKSRI